MKRFIKIFLLLNVHSFIHAQVVQPDFTFGNIKQEDFTPVAYPLDTGAAAVYLFDIGSAYFHEDVNTHYEEVYQRHTRIRLLNKNAFDLATLIIPLFSVDEDEQKIEDLQAATYNISNGKVIAEPIDKNSVFKEKSKGLKVFKLTLPDVKEGSIIEFSYTIKTPGIGIPGWNFQGKYPKIWTEYEVVIPYFYDYAVLKQGTLAYALDSTSSFHTDYSYYAYKPNEENTLQHEWVMQNVPAITPEPFTNTTDNYISKIEFQLSAYKNSYGQYVAYNRSWPNVAAKLMSNEAFGYEVKNENNRLKDVIKEAIGNAAESVDKAKRIFDYIRDNFTCTDNNAKYLSQDLKKTMQLKQGNVADINMLLIAMLVNINFTASPVLLSTTDNGKINYEYPVLSKYNYVICQLIIDKKQYLLDASLKYLPFNKLPDECYNGYAHVITNINFPIIYLSPNSLNESTTTTAIINGQKTNAAVTTTLSYQPSIEIKKLLGVLNKNDVSKKLKELLLNETAVENIEVNGLSNADSDINLKYNVPLDFGAEDVLYFAPLLAAQIKTNPFAAVKRTYPIELPYCKNEIYHLTMEIPQGYVVDELPKPAAIKLNGNDGAFDYTITKNENTLQLNVTLKLAKAIFEPTEYQSLRDFYTTIINKEAEQIVFKKVK